MKGMLFAATTQSDASVGFYRDKLGLGFLADTPYALVFAVGNTTLRVQKVSETIPVPYTTLGFSVPNLTDCVTELARKSVNFESYDFLQQDENGIWTAPDGTRVAWCRDPDNNLVSFTEDAAA